MKKEITYFINEWSKAVVECLDFLFLLSPDGLDVRVNLQMQRCQKTFIDLYSCNWRAYGWTGAPTFSRNHSWTGEGGPPVSAHTYWGVTAERLHGFLGVQHFWTTQPSEWERTESWGVGNSNVEGWQTFPQTLISSAGSGSGPAYWSRNNFQDMYGELWGWTLRGQSHCYTLTASLRSLSKGEILRILQILQ